MEDLTLEREFELYKLIHKTSIVEAKLQCFYKDLINTGVTIPSFMNENAEDKAKKHLLELLDDKDKFNRTYECIWNEIKWSLP